MYDKLILHLSYLHKLKAVQSQSESEDKRAYTVKKGEDIREGNEIELQIKTNLRLINKQLFWVNKIIY